MNVRVVKPPELAPDDIERWKEFQRQDSVLGSPFFCTGYIQAVSDVQPGVRVGIIERDGDIVGYFPFQRAARNIAHPVGLRLCDFSGPILRNTDPWDPESAVRSCGLSGWHFQNIVRSETMRRYEWTHLESPYLDLTGGFEQYRLERTGAGSAIFQEVARKSRKLQREVGPLRFEFHTNDESVFDLLLKWKADQRAQTKTFNMLSMNWAQALLRRIRAIQTNEFAGVLSALYAGDQLAAVHMGMRSRNVLHYWIPTYSSALGKYSPGSILLLEVARAASGIGVTRLDLGTGDEAYKARFKSGALTLGFGSVDCSLVSTVLSKIRCAAHRCSPSSPLYLVIASLKNLLQRAHYRAIVRSTRLERPEVCK